MNAADLRLMKTLVELYADYHAAVGWGWHGRARQIAAAIDRIERQIRAGGPAVPDDDGHMPAVGADAGEH